jgi:hypothetical protein
MSETGDIRTFIRKLFEECDRELDAWEARIEKDRGEPRVQPVLAAPPAHLDLTEDRRQRALLLEKARRLGRKRDE